jgi:hypothetical protein
MTSRRRRGAGSTTATTGKVRRGSPPAQLGEDPPKDAPAREMTTRVLALRNTISYVRRVVSTKELNAILATLPAAEQAIVQSAPDHDEVPYGIALRLWRSIDAVLSPRDPAWVEAMGADAARRIDEQLGAEVVHRSSPLTFLTQQIPFFRIYYRPGDMVLIEHGADHASIRLVGFEAGDPLFCRRFTAGWATALELSGGRDVVVRHLRCACEGDLFCEWSLRWTE